MRGLNALAIPVCSLFLLVSSGAVDDVASCVITGRVYDSDTGEGIGGVHVVDSFSVRTRRFSSSALTDQSGYYRIADVPAGQHEVTVHELKGYRHEKELLSEFKRVQLSSGQQLDNVDFPLVRGTTVSGKVVDAEGRPVPGAEVAGSTQSTRARTTAREDGSFELSGLKPSDTLRVQAMTDGRLGEPQGFLSLPDSGLSGVMLIINEGAGISGKVVDSSGRLVADALVAPLVQPGTPHHTYGIDRVKTNQQGQFKVSGMPAGTYRLMVHPPGSQLPMDNEEPDLVTLDVNEQLTDIILVRDIVGYFTIAGRVTDTAGQSLGRVRVSADGPSRKETETAQDGTYSLSGLPEGQYRVHFQYRSFTPTVVSGIEAGDRSANAVLYRKGAISGRVVHADTSQTLTDFEVAQLDEPFMASHEIPEHMLVSVHDETGRFRFDDVDVGTTTLFVRAHGFTPQTLTVDVSESQDAQEILVRLKAGGIVEGTITSKSGRPVADAAIHLQYDSYFSLRPIARSAEGGTFRLDMLPLGEQRIIVKHSDFAPVMTMVYSEADRTDWVEIVLPEATTFQGRVTIAGQPASDASVQVHMEEIEGAVGYFRTRTEADGTFRLSDLPVGEAGVSIVFGDERKRPGTTRQLRFPTTVGEGVNALELQFSWGPTTWEGQFLVDGEKPSRVGLRFKVERSDGIHEEVRVRADENGFCNVKGLPAGTYRVLPFVTPPGGGDGWTTTPRTIKVLPNRVTRDDFNLSFPDDFLSS